MLRNRKGRESGFTLIELLVVVAIIALLISILLPSLSKAREVAKMVKCLAIQKQYGMANAMYADAYEGVHVPGWSGGSAASIWYRNVAFRQMIGMNGTNWEASEGLLCPSAPEEEFTNSDKHQSRSTTPWAGHWDHVYGVNGIGITFGPRRYAENGIYVRRMWIMSPSEKINFADATNYEFGGASTINGVQWQITGDRNSRRAPGANILAYRHGEMAVNGLHYDGHASNYSFPEAYHPTSQTARDRLWLTYAVDK